MFAVLSGNPISFAVNYARGGSSSRQATWIETSDVDLCTGDPVAAPNMRMGLMGLLAALL